jgi:hypothetical protein
MNVKSRSRLAMPATLEKILDEVIAANPAQVEQYRKRQEDSRRIFRWPGDEGQQGPGEPCAGE